MIRTFTFQKEILLSFEKIYRVITSMHITVSKIKGGFSNWLMDRYIVRTKTVFAF